MAAMEHDLRDPASSGDFSPELFYRLKMVHMELPRREPDVSQLAP